MADILDTARRIHFVGIGGSGIIPVAEIMHALGKSVSGSDGMESDNVNRLHALGIPIVMNHSAGNITPDIDLVVYTAAVSPDNPELLEAARLGTPVMERGEAVGILTGRYPRGVAVAGTHGKTTSTAMLSQILLEAGIDPSVYIGGRLPLINANGRAGQSDLMVFEACEWQDHYLEMSYTAALILNVDADHLDYFGDLDGVIASFRKFAARAETVIVNGDDVNSLKAVEGLDAPLIAFGLSESNDWSARNIIYMNGSYGVFDLYHDGIFFNRIEMGVPGAHNISNALGVAAAAHLCGADAGQIAAGIKHFRGAGRRFEFLGEKRGVTVIDDYAHHPTEIAATLKAAKAMNFGRVWAVFQPFTFSRTARHLGEFAEALSLADMAIVSDIMGSREVNTYGVHAKQITDQMPNGQYIAAFPEITDYICANTREDDLILTMGGGNVYQCARMILERL